MREIATQEQAEHIGRSLRKGAPVKQILKRGPVAFSVRQRRNLWGVLFVLPAIVFLLAVMIGPIFFNFWLSLHKWNPLAALSTMEWIGFENYTYLLTVDTQFWAALRNSTTYAVARVVGNVVIGLALALLMNAKRLKGLKAWRVALFLPIATAPAVLGKIWAAMFHPDFGIINAILGLFGFTAVGWLTNPEWALRAILIIALYEYVGYYAVIFLAALQGIPEELIDAAQVDGAGPLRVLWNIILPLLRPVIAFVVVISTVYGLQVFDLVWSTTHGGPANSTNTTVLHMYNNVFVNSRAGMGAAEAFILFMIIMVVAIFQLKLISQQQEAQ